MPKKEYKYGNIVEKQGVTGLIILFHFFLQNNEIFFRENGYKFKLIKK